MTVRIPNTSQAQQAPAAPTRADGSPYPIEVVYGGGKWRGYADTHEDLLDLLIDGYPDLATDDDRLRARIRAAVDAQVALQADLTAEGLDACTAAQRKVLLGSRDIQPRLDFWDAPVPLVLVSSFYQPDGTLPRPVEAGGEIWWLDPTSATTLLESLAVAGWLQLHQLDPDPPAPGADAG